MSTVLSPPSPVAALPASPGGLQGAEHGRARLALSLQAAVLSHRRCEAAGTAFATEIAIVFGCARVSLGFVQRGYARIDAVSHGTPGRAEGEAFELVAAAMDEAIDQGISVAWPVASGVAAPGVRLAQGRLQQRQGGAVASVPLQHLGEGVGALCCEWAGQPDNLASRIAELEDVVSLIGPVLYLMREGQAGWREQVARAGRAQWARLRSREARSLRLALLALPVLAAAALLLPVDHRIGGHARIEAEQQRSLVAPLDGLIKSVGARPGDKVKAGQVLVEMADQDLLLQRRKWSGELAQHESTYASALARADRTNMVVGFARAEEARAQLGLIDAELARTRLLAPFDGIVIAGDLSQSLGAPVERGQVLMQIAPGERHRVVVQVDEHDINLIQVGQHGTLALAALPWNTLPIEVQRITPIARSVEGSNVFEVEAALTTPVADIRPGLEGSAKLEVGEQPLGVTAWQRFARWARLLVFTWWP